MVEYRGDQRTIKHILEDRARQLGDKTFLRYKDLKVSYKEINETANRVANSLMGMGVRKGDHVLLMLPNGPEIIYSWFGMSKMGAVEVPVNVNLKGNTLLHVLNDSRARYMIVHRQYLEKLAFIQRETNYLETLIVLGEGGEADPTVKYKMVDFGELLKGSPEPPDVQIRAGDPATIMYTSGTTGPPKGVIQPQAYAYAYAKEAVIPSYSEKDVFVEENDIYYSYLPLYHTAGKYVDVVGTLLAGATVVLAERFSPSTFWTEASSYNATVTYALFTAAFLYRMPPKPDDADNTIKKVLCVPLIPEINDFAKRFGVKVWAAYGLSEGGSVFIGRIPENLKDFRFMGRLRKDFEVRLADPDGYEVPVGKVGEILQRPKEPFTTMLGYYNLPDKTVEAWSDLWLHTGDLAFRDEEGNYYFVGRVKENIRRRGENISPESIEKEINLHPAVLESAVVGVPSEFGLAGENEIMAVIVLKEGQQLKPEELITFLEPRLPYFMVPRYIKFATDLPRTPTEKVRRAALKEKWSEGEIWDLQKSGIKLKR
jgi:crotonobetaine/carnitine-CoA ligase